MKYLVGLLSICLLGCLLLFGMACKSTATTSKPSGGTTANTTVKPTIKMNTVVVNSTSSPVSVVINSQSFEPYAYSIPAGTMVIWNNQDTVSHRVTSELGNFEGTIASGGEFNYTFSEAGTYNYYDKSFPDMKGKIIVK
jgi:plastocyanin